ncbi:hypothetical protein [Massilia sp. YMA4]|uniref:hypothetical protein n=1 Tax=Massilia sp. YMA4 TaxID=1593482 RepID=UPI001D0C4CAC|nr:hypothetical protein [Massilia sp. YMA4]
MNRKCGCICCVNWRSWASRSRLAVRSARSLASIMACQDNRPNVTSTNSEKNTVMRTSS